MPYAPWWLDIKIPVEGCFWPPTVEPSLRQYLPGPNEIECHGRHYQIAVMRSPRLNLLEDPAPSSATVEYFTFRTETLAYLFIPPRTEDWFWRWRAPKLYRRRLYERIRVTFIMRDWVQLGYGDKKRT